MLEIIKKIVIGISKNKKTILLVVLFCCVFGLGIAGPAKAAEVVSTAVAVIVGTLTSLFVTFFGWLLTVLIKMLVNVAQFNDFIKTEVVTAGWVVVRDLCNMFFVLIVLVIAFATILKYENYHVKKLLPKLLIMAILINFSKTICGLIIDFSQVIMLTFVSAFAEHGAGNFINLFNVQNFTSIGDAWKGDISGWNVAAGFIAGLFALIITNVVVLIMLAVLVMRIIMLWIYIILSPLAFLLSAFPAGAKYAQQWWGEFSKQVIVGPVLAFFLWLALTTVQESAKYMSSSGYTEASEEVCAGPASIFCEGNFQVYIVTIGFLIGGLIVTQQLGGMAGAAAGRGIGWIRSGAVAHLKGVKKLAKNVGGWGLDKASGVAGIDLNVVEGYKRVQAQMEKNKRDRRQELRGKVLDTADEKGGPTRSTLAHLSTGDLAWRNISNWRKGGLKSFGKSGKWRTQQFEDIEQERDKIKGLKEQRFRVLSDEDGTELIKSKEAKGKGLQILQEEIKHKEEIRKDESRSFDERDKAGQDIVLLRKHESDVKGEIGKIEAQQKNINPAEAKRLDEAIKNSNSKIKSKDDQLETYKKGGMWEARKETAAALTQEQGKAAEYTDNSQELGAMIVDAIKNGQQGLVSVIAKKMTRNGDYNEMLKALKLGTGREGMLGFADKLQQGGFSQQGALGLVGEVGNLAKNIKHFGAFGAVTMENGRWRESSEPEYEAAKYAEMSKVQVQAFARDTGRLGLGHYEKMEGDGDDWEHDEKHWVLDKSAIAILKSPSYAQHYDKEKGTANKSAIGHLALDVNVDILEKNEATAVAANVKGRQNETKVDPMAAVRGVKK